MYYGDGSIVVAAFRDLNGQVFGDLTVLGEVLERGPCGYVQWMCECSCGKVKIISSQRLRPGKQQSCGCKRIVAIKKANTKHGRSSEPLYAVWRSMIARCTNAKNKAWPNYGGRGIKVCDDWFTSYEVFTADMGPCPKYLTLERKDNDGNYEPGNCVWATRKAQANNRRVAKI